MLLQKEETPESQRTGHVKTYKQLSAHPGEKPHQKSTLLHLYLRLPASGPGMRALAGNPTLRVAKAGGSQSSSPVWATSQDCLKKKKKVGTGGAHREEGSPRFNPQYHNGEQERSLPPEPICGTLSGQLEQALHPVTKSTLPGPLQEPPS